MIIENCVVRDTEGQAKTFSPNSRVNNLMEDRREPHIFYDVCHLATLWKSLRLNRLFPMHETHIGPGTGDDSGSTTLYRGAKVSNVAPLCQLPWHITTHDLLHFFFLFMDVYSTSFFFFFLTSVQKSLPFYLFNG